MATAELITPVSTPDVNLHETTPHPNGVIQPRRGTPSAELHTPNDGPSDHAEDAAKEIWSEGSHEIDSDTGTDGTLPKAWF